MNAAGIGFLFVLALLVTVVTSPIFWGLVGAVLVAGILIKFIDHYYKNIWPDKYFNSEEFLEQKDRSANT